MKRVCQALVFLLVLLPVLALVNPETLVRKTSAGATAKAEISVGQATLQTPTPTWTPSETATNTAVDTATDTETPLPTDTATASATPTDSVTATATTTDTPTSTSSATATATSVATSTNTSIPTATNTATRTPTRTPTKAPTSTPAPLPSMSLGATSGIPGSTFAVQIRHFPANTRVAIYIAGTRIATFTTDATGSARNSVIVPQAPYGSQPIVAHGGGKTVTKSLAIKASLSVTETTVVAGNTISVRVEGFYAYETVAIRIYDVSSTTYHTMGSILTNSKGTGKGTVTVPRSTLAGKHKIEAVKSHARASDAVNVRVPTATRTPTPKPTRTPTPRPTATRTATVTTNCLPNYPDFCIPGGADKDCSDFPGHRNFRVIGSDPYDLDSDNDGYACESN